MKLPAALSFWAAELAIFPRELALSMGPTLRRLSPVIGPFHRALHAGMGEVDGFDGLALRGSYERLLTSEWLFADELPEEFDRRAAMGEHTFLRLARPEAVGSRRSVALFDAGPEQIGSPRLVHLAILVLLARRASAAGAEFGWGVLQDRERTLLDVVTPATVKHLLGARTDQSATEADLERWRARIGSPRADDDLWIVGSRQVTSRASARSAACIEVRDLLVPRVRQVGAVVQQRGQVVEVTLDLPGEADSVRLLRDPFTARAAVPVQVLPKQTPTSTAVFAADGFRLFARGRLGGLLEYEVPSSPRHDVSGPRPRQVDTQGFVLAAGRVGDYLILISAQGRTFELHYVPRGAERKPFPLPAGYKLPRDVGTLAACHVLEAARQDLELAFHDGRGTLVRLSEQAGQRSSFVLATRVVACAPAEGGILWVESRTTAGSRRAVRLRGEQRTELPLKGDGSAHFGFGGSLAHPDWGLLAVEAGPHSFNVWHAKGTSTIRVPADCLIVGVGSNLRRREPGLLVLDADRHSLVQVGQSWTRRLPREAEVIEGVTTSPASNDVAYTTSTGELVLYSLDQEAVLRRYRPAVKPGPKLLPPGGDVARAAGR